MFCARCYWGLLSSCTERFPIPQAHTQYAGTEQGSPTTVWNLKGGQWGPLAMTVAAGALYSRGETVAKRKRKVGYCGNGGGLARGQL